jgi:hypothetical protein
MTKVIDIEDYIHGLVTEIEDESIPPGSASSMLNARTLGDKVEIRRGSRRIGDDVGASEPSRGVHTAFQADDTPILYRKRDRKLEYSTYDADTDEYSAWAECGSDLFPAAAVDDEASFANYQSQAGAILFITSPNSSIYKVMTANPASATDLASTDHKGRMIIHKGRSFLWARKGSNGVQDNNSLYLSWIDAQNYTAVSNEAVGTGDGATLVFNHTLAFKAGSSKRTCFGVSIEEDTVVKFVDDYKGNLVHVSGASVASGTINYTTGAIVLTYTAGNAPANAVAITADYQWEDSTDEGVADFSFSGTRLAGEGDILPQNEGGPLNRVEAFNDQYFCFHARSIYRVILSADDTDADNNVFRSNTGTPTHRSVASGADGIYYVDAARKGKPQIRLLTIEAGSTETVPKRVSTALDLSGYEFEDAWMLLQGTTVLIGCRASGSDTNNRVFVFDESFDTWDVQDYLASCATTFGDVLIMGDALSGNVFEGFSGVDDDDSTIPFSYTMNQWDLEITDRLKKVKKLCFEGHIASSQIIDVAISFDDATFVVVGQIRGDGAYVDTGAGVTVGPTVIGRGEIGGGSDGINAYHYFCELSLRSAGSKFSKAAIRLSTGIDSETAEEGIGYFSFSRTRFQDIRVKQAKLPSQYRNQGVNN